MPHAENGTMNGPITNGEKPSSRAISHLTSYPVVSDSISAYKSNPYGAKSINIAQTAFDRLAKPLLPYLQGPYSYIAPYLAKADSLADDGLSKVETRFPIVKEDTNKVKGTFMDYAQVPLQLVGQGREYLFKMYSDERKKTAGDGLVATAKTWITVGLKVELDAFHKLQDYLKKGKETAQKSAEEK